MRAAVPPLIIPHTADQPYWAERIHALGVGPKAIPRYQLSAENLAKRIIAAVSNPQIKRRAAALGESIQDEDGLARAVKLIEQSVAAAGSS